MFWNHFYCLICGVLKPSRENQEHGCCYICFKILKAQILYRPFHFNPLLESHVFSHYSYSTSIRKLILDTKITKNFSSLKFLCHQILESESLLQLSTLAENVMPCPSSLWSRSRGKFDIAGVLAKEISLKYGLNYCKPPWKLSFEIRKRAMLNPKEKYSRAKEPIFKSVEKKYKNMLFIDDVITTGTTLRCLKSYLNIDRNYFFCIAKSKSPNK